MENKKRLIDANKIPYHQSGFPKGDGFDSGLDWAFRADIDKIPTVDAVEVVRCCQCKHHKMCEDGSVLCKFHSEHGERDSRGGAYSVWMEPNDFCSYGERRTNE